MWQFDTEFSEIIKRTPNIKSFRFPIHTEKAPFEPGQFFFVTIEVHGVNNVHHFSFSSSPTDGEYIEFTKRITISSYSQTLDKVREGTWAYIKGPFGKYTLPSAKQLIAFLTGGIGITPIISMLRYIAYYNHHYDIVLLYGNENYESIAFYQGLDELSRSLSSFRVEHFLSQPQSYRKWRGKRGYINKDIVIETIPDYKDRLFYISGPPKMVLYLTEELNNIKISEEQIMKDSFTGYD